jgi:hypothetical protein
MKRTSHLAVAMLLSLGLFGQASQSPVSGSCQNGGTFPDCVGGETVFTSTKYTGQVHVKVTNSSGEVIDDGYYTTTSEGVLSFFENLSFADTYTVAINDQIVLTVTTH